jgi:hypothetical protein
MRILFFLRGRGARDFERARIYARYVLSCAFVRARRKNARAQNVLNVLRSAYSARAQNKQKCAHAHGGAGRTQYELFCR